MGRIALRDYDAGWPARYDEQAVRLRAALGERVLRLEHVGSTSVPGLSAKPIIDVVLEVENSALEPAYAQDLERAGYVLRVREPHWFEHRMFNDEHGTANVHVFSAGCPETDRMIAFRDWLRHNAADRELYAQVKWDLARRDWASVQDYADAKTDVVGAIMARALPPS